MKEIYKIRLCWDILLKPVSMIVISTFFCAVVFASQSDLEARVKALTLQDIPALMQNAESGNAEAQYVLGRAYYLGQALSRDFGEAYNWNKKAADQGLAIAEFRLYQMLLTGSGVPKDTMEAVNWLRKSAEDGYPKAQYLVGYTADQKGNFEEALKWYRKAAAQNDASAQIAIGFFYEMGRGVEQDYKEAVVWYRKAAEQGDSNAQSNLGNMYFGGKGVAQDYIEAAKWFHLSAEQGWPTGQVNLAGLYISGKGVPRDLISAYMWCSLAAAGGENQCKDILKILASKMSPDDIQAAQQRALSWIKGHQQLVKLQNNLYTATPKKLPDAAKKIQDAAESGNPEAQSVLGEMYYRSQDYEEAMKWFLKSAEQGYSYGQYNLGVMYFEGSGVTKNESEGVKWFTKAAEQWHIGAINNLMVAYFQGRGVPKDLVSVYMWTRIGASTGDTISESNLKEFKKMITTEQITEAEEKASTWMAEHKRQ